MSRFGPVQDNVMSRFGLSLICLSRFGPSTYFLYSVISFRKFVFIAIVFIIFII